MTSEVWSCGCCHIFCVHAVWIRRIILIKLTWLLEFYALETSEVISEWAPICVMTSEVWSCGCCHIFGVHAVWIRWVIWIKLTWLLEFYALETSEVISEWVPTCAITSEVCTYSCCHISFIHAMWIRWVIWIKLAWLLGFYALGTSVVISEWDLACVKKPVKFDPAVVTIYPVSMQCGFIELF